MFIFLLYFCGFVFLPLKITQEIIFAGRVEETFRRMEANGSRWMRSISQIGGGCQASRRQAEHLIAVTVNDTIRSVRKMFWVLA